MNKILSSVGVLALSAAGMQAAYAPGLSSMETSKPWSVSASLRGFYDDNYTTDIKALAPSSFGFEVTPSAALNLPLDQTFIGLSYIYSMRYYEDRVSDSADHSHQFNGKLDHAFSERYQVRVSDNFVIAQEPEILNPAGTPASFSRRADGSNIRNTAGIDFTAQMTPLLSTVLGYENSYYDFEKTGVGQYSSLLDRMEHLASLNLRYQVLPQTVGLLGYQYGIVDYTSNENVAPGTPADSRNARSHYAFIGADQNFNQQLNGSLRIGARFTDHYKFNQEEVSPYAQVNLTYAYAPGSSLQVGMMHDRTPTDQAISSGSLVLDRQNTMGYVSLTHMITAKISGSVLGQYQHGTAETVGGVADSSENTFNVGASLSYKINQHFMAEGGYYYDRLDSDTGFRSYTRNRVFVGIRATY